MTVAPLDLEGHCIAAVFLGDVPHFAMADGAVHRLDHGHKTIQANDGLLAAFLDAANDRLITGGEDGKVFS
ncbi:MAG: WD40 repeat domain-containing protein, partial [Mesorhizobium sp.]